MTRFFMWIMMVNIMLLSACSSLKLPPAQLTPPQFTQDGEYEYRIGAGDTLTIFVWRNSDISGDYNVRPDGRISIALTDTLLAAGKTSEELALEVTKALSVYIKTPKVTVMVKNVVGNTQEQIRIIGDAGRPFTAPYRYGMTLLDLIIQAGGLTRYADGNNAYLLRIKKGKTVRYELSIEDLIDKGDLNANVDLLPGDIIYIPETWF